MRGSCFVLLVLLLAGSVSTASAQARWRLQEIVRIGGADEGLASFNQIGDLQIDADGKVWVLDFQTQSLRLFAADGAPIKEAARRGRGPGELARANGVRIGPDGRMYVRDYSNARIAVYGADGATLTSHMVMASGYGYLWDGGVDGQQRVVERTTVRRGEEFTTVILRRSPDFQSADTTEVPARCAIPTERKGSIQGKSGFVSVPFAPRLLMKFGRTGATWCGSTDEYRVRRFAFGAVTADVEVTRTVPRVPIAKAERDAAIARVDSFLVRIGGPVDPWKPSEVARDRGPMVAFETDDQDRLWVLRELPSGQMEFDVWDTRGKHIASLPSPLKYDFIPLFRIHGDRVAMMMLDEDDLPTIVVSRIVRP